MLHQSKLFMAAMATTISVCASAQVTTSAVSGQVIDETGQPVIGATVLAVHEPSGTQYGAVTNQHGRTIYHSRYAYRRSV